jgi:hypothetical protein
MGNCHFLESGCQPDLEEVFRCQVVSSSLTDAGWRILKQFARETRSIRPAADLTTSPLFIVCLGHACGETLPTGLLVISEPTGLDPTCFGVPGFCLTKVREGASHAMLQSGKTLQHKQRFLLTQRVRRKTRTRSHCFKIYHLLLE